MPLADRRLRLRMAFSVSLAGGSVDEDDDNGGDGVMNSAERKSSSSIKSSSSCEPPCSWTPAGLRCLAGRGRITSWLPIVPSYFVPRTRAPRQKKKSEREDKGKDLA